MRIRLKHPAWQSLPMKKLMQLVALARKYGEAIAVHVIGDAAVEKALDAIEKHPVPEGKRDRLIHVNVLRDDLSRADGKAASHS